MGSKANKTYLFEQAPIPTAVIQLSIPVVISSLVTILYNLADTYFVGMLNNPIQNAAVTLVYPVMMGFNTINNLFGIGTSSMMSRKLGAGDHDAVRKASAFGFWGAFICAFLLGSLTFLFRTPFLHLLGSDDTTIHAASAYMLWTVNLGAVPAIANLIMAYMFRSEGSALQASIGTMSGCVLNIILDPIFILPQFLNMGAAGAGLATFLSNCAVFLYFLILYGSKKENTFICLNPLKLKTVTRDIVFGVLGVGVPSSIQNILKVTTATVLNNLTAAYGPVAVAAMGIAYKIFTIPAQIALGFSQGVMPLVSYNYASGNRQRMKRAITHTFRLVFPIMLSLTALYWFFSGPLILLFTQEPEIVAYGSVFLRRMCIAICFHFTDFLVVNICQALGMGKWALIFAVIRKVVLEIPLLFILDRLQPMYGLASAQCITEMVLAVIAVTTLLRIFKEAPDLPR